MKKLKNQINYNKQTMQSLMKENNKLLLEKSEVFKELENEQKKLNRLQNTPTIRELKKLIVKSDNLKLELVKNSNKLSSNQKIRMHLELRKSNTKISLLKSSKEYINYNDTNVKAIMLQQKINGIHKSMLQIKTQVMSHEKQIFELRKIQTRNN